jgi:hypothetical protein
VLFCELCAFEHAAASTSNKRLVLMARSFSSA